MHLDFDSKEKSFCFLFDSYQGLFSNVTKEWGYVYSLGFFIYVISHSRRK